jgi:hypothetical protein
MLTVPVRIVRTGHVAGPYNIRGRSIQDTWHLQMMTCVRHFWTFGRMIDQFGGDTCHHWKGDMWHKVTSASCVSDDVSSTRGAVMVEVMWQVDDVAHFYWLMLTSHVLTRVWIAGKWDEDTWPNLEAPRVTHYLVDWFVY